MGNTFRKFLQTEPVEDRHASLPGIGCLFEDPRSPTEGIHRTPIVLEKKPYLETDVDALTPPSHPRLHLLKKQLDPRSPSSFIDRTPISILGTDIGSNIFESPLSIYSRYEGDFDSTLNMTPPLEPSVNVSDFESEEEELPNVAEDLLVSDLQSPEELSPTTELIPERHALGSNEKLKTKQICEDLINEIIESFKECQDLIKDQDEFVPQPTKSKKLTSTNENHKSVKSVKKNRVPLSNITSSAGNTPTKLSIRKGENVIKIQQTGENSPLTPVNRKFVRAQWDNDTTVLI